MRSTWFVMNAIDLSSKPNPIWTTNLHVMTNKQMKYYVEYACVIMILMALCLRIFVTAKAPLGMFIFTALRGGLISHNMKNAKFVERNIILSVN